ncbi:putative replication initiation protein [Botrytis cinerea genomovirus 1]|nr:putative replication initiation protein [Botrytis cinerea genomovirus 1]
MLTYAQIDDTFDRKKFGPWLKEKCGALTIRVALEEHKETGGLHIHAYVEAPTQFTINSADFLDYCGHHPNILPIRVTFYKTWDYVGKDGDIIFEEGPPPPRPAEKSGSAAVWTAIVMAANTVDEFLEEALKSRPGDLIKNFTQFKAFAEWRYKPKGLTYVSPEIVCHMEDYPQLEQWVLENLRGGLPAGARKQSLVMWGDTRLGKTLWARSLGKHAYFPGMFMLDGFNEEGCEYAIFDDIIEGFKGIASYKGWFGSQHEVVVTDKYRMKQRITWGRPSVFISNTDPRDDLPRDQVKWLEGNCVFVHIDKVLCEPYVGESPT